MRLSATASLLSFNDVICVASVSANYGLGNPSEYQGMVAYLNVGERLNQRNLLTKLVDMGYKRNDAYFDRGDFRVNGDVVDIYPAYYNDEALRVEFFGDEIEVMYHFDVLDNKKLKDVGKFTLYATSQFIVGADRLKVAIKDIEKELDERLAEFNATGRLNA